MCSPSPVRTPKQQLSTEQPLPGASVRNSAHGKCHDKGGFSIRKGRIEPQETPYSHTSTPQTRILLYCFMLSPTPLTLRGAVPHHLSQRRS